jgi:hypothetical protein
MRMSTCVYASSLHGGCCYRNNLLHVTPQHDLSALLLHLGSHSGLAEDSSQWRTQEFCSGGGGGFNKFSCGQDIEKGDLGAVAA